MSIRTSYAVPAHGLVAREQLRLVGLAVRREALLAGLLLLVVTALLAITHLRSLSDPEYHSEFAFLPIVSLPMVALAFLAPLAVWKGDEPWRRGYLWSLPVDRRRMQLSKSAAGWLWVMGAVALYMAWAWAMAALSGGDIGVDTTLVWVGDDPRNPSPSDWQMLAAPVPAWQWATPFTAATIAYLLGSMLVIASNRPWLPAAAVWIAWLLFAVAAEALEAQPLQDAVSAVMDGPYSAKMALTGEMTVNERVTLPGGGGRSWSYDRPDLRAWLVATLIWMGIGAAGTLIAATRYRDA